MRKLIIGTILLLSAVSCVHQWPEPAVTQVVLNLVYETNLPMGPEIDVSTRAADDSEQYDIRYIIHAYELSGSGNIGDTPYATYMFTQDDITSPDNTFTLDIMEGQYRFMVWSDYVKQGTTEDMFYNADSLKYIKLYGRDEGHKHVGNEDLRDAFLGWTDVDVIRYGGHHPPVSCTAHMTRPLSKVVFITTDLDDWKTKVITNYYQSALQGSQPGESIEIMTDVDVTQYTVKIQYPQYMPNAFNMMTDRTTWSDVNVSFESKITPLGNQEAALGFDYVFANATDANVVMAVSLYDKTGTQLARSRDITVPLERGKVTTVRGSFLLEESDGGVSINPDFDGEFNIVI